MERVFDTRKVTMTREYRLMCDLYHNQRSKSSPGKIHIGELGWGRTGFATASETYGPSFGIRRTSERCGTANRRSPNRTWPPLTSNLQLGPSHLAGPLFRLVSW
jgi:hypothetical protein